MSAPPARPDDSALRRFLRITGSLKFAVCLISFFALASLIGMVVESKTDAVYARAQVYNAWWFNFAFGLLWLNIFSAAMVRYPWPKRLTGFVITHLGLLIIIIASLISRVAGVEGQMILSEGESSRVLIQSERKALHVKLPDGRSYAVPGGQLQTLNVDRPRRIGDSEWAFEVTEYLMASRIDRGFVRAPQGPPAAEVVVAGGQFGELPRWVMPAEANARARRIELPMLLVDTSWLRDAEAVARFETAEDQVRGHRGWYEVRESDGQMPGEGQLRLRLRDGSERMIAVAELRAGDVDLGGGRRVVFRQLVTNAIVGTDSEGRSALVEEPDPSRGAGPALEFDVVWAGDKEQHAAFARMPEFESRKGGHAAAPIQGRAVALGFTPEGGVLARVHDERGGVIGAVSPLAVGEPLVTPWNGITVTVRRFFEASQRRAELVDASASPPPRGEDALPGVRLNLYGPGGMAPVWLQLHAPQALHHPGGHVQLDWTHGRHPIDFTVRLIDFRKVDYPGTTRAAAFESDVRVEDPVRGRNEQVTISMNYPLEHGGVAWWPGSDWAFYQSSYQQPPGAPEISVFSVAYDPGYGLNMVGSALVVFGIFTMFYLVPYFRPTRKRPETPPTAATGDAEATP